MLLIGFMWIFVSTAAAILVKPFFPGGRWEDHGPTVMMVTATASFFAGSLGAVIADGVLGYNWSSGEDPWLGVILSVVGGAVAFGAYVIDARRNPREYAS